MQAAPFYNDLAEGPEGGNAWWLNTRDGVRIRAAHWPGGNFGTVFMFPGRTEYIEKYGRTAARLAKRGYGTVAIDWRGQGLADRLTDDPMVGHVNAFDDFQYDVDAVVALARELDLPRPWFLIGHSMGGCIGLRAVHLKLAINAAAFSAPMWGIKMTAAQRVVAKPLSHLAHRIGRGHMRAPGTSRGSYVLDNPFEGNLLTGSRDEYDLMRRQLEAIPEFALGGPSLSWLYGALAQTEQLFEMRAPACPTVTFLGEHEDIVDTGPIHQMVARWPNGELKVVDDAQHEFPMEQPQPRDAFLDAADALFKANS